MFVVDTLSRETQLINRHTYPNCRRCRRLHTHPTPGNLDGKVALLKMLGEVEGCLLW
jgi:hypothetical protein